MGSVEFARQESCRSPWGPRYDIYSAWYISGYHWPSVSNIKNRIQSCCHAAYAVYANTALVYYNSRCFNNGSGCSGVNHAVLLCGWDDSKCSSGAWRMQNSWGTGWGENGMAWMKYGICNIGYAASYVRI